MQHKTMPPGLAALCGIHDGTHVSQQHCTHSSSSSSSSLTRPASRQIQLPWPQLQQVAGWMRHPHQQTSRRNRLLAAVLLLLLMDDRLVAAVPTQCGVKPVCPSRREALSRKPVFDTDPAWWMQHSQHSSNASSSAGSHAHRQHRRTHKAASGNHSITQHMSVDAAASLLVGMHTRRERLYVFGAAHGHGMLAHDMLQRVLPTAHLLKLSREEQQQLFAHLLGVLQGDTGNISSSGNASTAAAAAVSAAVQQGFADVPPLPAAAPSVVAAPAGSLLFLSNARLRVGVDPMRGGAITYMSSAALPPEWANVNLVNTWDAGRLIQQSYYGCYDNSCWADRPWRWNPVQGGSWQNGPPKLLASSMGADSVTVASVPRNWGGQQLLDDVVMITQTELLPNLVKVRFTMRYTGNVTHPRRHQEVPAVFVHRRLNVLAMYTGKQPWTNGTLTFIMPGQAGEYHKPSEGPWAAYVDQASGFGLGVYTPGASQLVAYRIGPEASSKCSDVSYLAPLVTHDIKPNTEFSYEAYLAIGRVDEMRGWFAEVAARLRLQTAQEAGPSHKQPVPQGPRATAITPAAALDPLSLLLLEPKPGSGAKGSTASKGDHMSSSSSPPLVPPPAAVKVSVKAPAAVKSTAKSVKAPAAATTVAAKPSPAKASPGPSRAKAGSPAAPKRSPAAKEPRSDSPAVRKQSPSPAQPQHKSEGLSNKSTPAPAQLKGQKAAAAAKQESNSNGPGSSAGQPAHGVAAAGVTAGTTVVQASGR